VVGGGVLQRAQETSRKGSDKTLRLGSFAANNAALDHNELIPRVSGSSKEALKP
jgi:hypothetical protein